MRSYAPYNKDMRKSRAGAAKKRETREACEWDIRIDCTSNYADVIVETLKNVEHLLTYALVSGIEQPDDADTTWGSKNLHVHIALVFKSEFNRNQVLAYCRGLIKQTDEYAVPRNQGYTYAGWYIHHVKADVKILSEPYARYEFGILPVDPVTPKNCKAIKALLRKFGSDNADQKAALEIKFGTYLEPFKKEK